jgi:predicted heme/steroid binding protein
MRKFTLEELKKYDGQNGNKVYIAYKGRVYDVSDSPVWEAGDHFAHIAGMDLTDELPDAPHEEEVFEGLEEVGALA